MRTRIKEVYRKLHVNSRAEAVLKLRRPDAPSGTWHVRIRGLGAGGASLPSAEVVIVVP